MQQLEVVRIIAAHPESSSVDVLLVRTGARVSGVQVLTGMAGADHGVSGLVAPAEQDEAKPAEAQVKAERVIYGVMAMAGLPVLLGFLHPQVSQTLFADRNRFVWRHPSDLYATATDAGDLEIAHPSGTFIRIGESPEHEDLTGQDHDQRWAIARNTDKQPSLRIAVAAGGTPHTTLTIEPGGKVTLECDGDLELSAGGAATIHSAGKLTLQSDDSIEATAPRIDLN